MNQCNTHQPMKHTITWRIFPPDDSGVLMRNGTDVEPGPSTYRFKIKSNCLIEYQ